MTTIVSYGGGMNSTAMLVGMVRRSYLPPHAILFADTGGEKPHTYDYISMFSDWLFRWGYPAITVVKKGGKQETLEEECLRKRCLPSIAYGFKTCSLKYKIEPQEKWCNNDAVCKQTWDDGHTVKRMIGFHIDEMQRVRAANDGKYTNEFPLIHWDYDQAACEDEITAVDLPLPGKSACFFCPNNKSSEVRELARVYPELCNRALAMEDNADLSSIKGLGRHFSWRDVLNQVEMFPDIYDRDMPCGCYDGEAA